MDPGGIDVAVIPEDYYSYLEGWYRYGIFNDCSLQIFKKLKDLNSSRINIFNLVNSRERMIISFLFRRVKR